MYPLSYKSIQVVHLLPYFVTVIYHYEIRVYNVYEGFYICESENFIGFLVSYTN